MDFNLSFYNNKKVLITGHTGFKGTWMSVMLANAGANICGYSQYSAKDNMLFDISGIERQIKHIVGDIRDLEYLQKVFMAFQPEIVIHMAAQPLVRKSYEEPVETYSTNVMGTVNVLECVRLNPCVRSFLNVTTDKVYENNDLDHAFKEDEPLDGYDPYSNSKSCSELVTHSYKKSFFYGSETAISTARAGNVIGGGDFARDRIIPDCVRAAIAHEDIVIRNPYSTRPFQHVLEPVYAYLMIAAAQYTDRNFEGYYNVGPEDGDCYQTGRLADTFIRYWGSELKWINRYDGGPYEAKFLKLDCQKLKDTFNWKPKWDLEKAVEKTVAWSKVWISGGDVRKCMDNQIKEFIEK